MFKIDTTLNTLNYSQDVIPVRVWCVEWNNAGTLLAACGSDKSVKLYKFSENEPFLEYSSTLKGFHSKTVRKVSFSPCDRYLASAGFDAAVCVFKLVNGDYEELSKLEGQENEIKCCGFSISGAYLASCSRDRSVWVWQMDEDEDLDVTAILQEHTQDVKYVRWHPSDEFFVSCGYEGSLFFYRCDDCEWVVQQKIEDAHDGTLWCCDFSGDGNFLVSVGGDSTVKASLFDIPIKHVIWRRCDYDRPPSQSTWKKVLENKVATRWPHYTVSWNKLNGLIAVAGADRALRVFRLEENNTLLCEVYSIQWRSTEINCVHWNPKKPEYLAVGSDDGLLQVLSIDV